MPDMMDRLAEQLAAALGARRGDILPSAAPGGGPAAGREGPTENGGTGGKTPNPPPTGARPQAVLGYGGHGDPTVLVDAPRHTRQELQELVDATARTRLQDKLRSRVRWQIPYSPEGHNQDGWRFIVGPWSMLDGSTNAPGAGNSTVNIPLAIPAGTAGPFIFLDRYPGALYFLIYVRTFAWMRLGSTMTGVQELYFTDPGGAVVGLGIYDAGASAQGAQSVGALCNTQITDPGNANLGQIVVQNIGIGGTPVGSRYQIGLGYVAMMPDPWFQTQQLRPPTPADVTSALLAAEANS